MTNLKLHHPALAIRQIKLKGTTKCVRCFLVIIEHEVASHRRNSVRKSKTQAPSRDIHLMDSLVAQVPVAGFPDPVPVVVKPIVEIVCTMYHYSLIRDREAMVDTEDLRLMAKRQAA